MLQGYRARAFEMGREYVADVYGPLMSVAECCNCGEYRAVRIGSAGAMCSGCIVAAVEHGHRHGLVAESVADEIFGGRWLRQVDHLAGCVVAGVISAA